jgi:Mg/Co/Ni transporter MgtE
VKAMTDKELVTIVNTQAADDVTDTVGEMPANLASKVLKSRRQRHAEGHQLSFEL